MTLAAIFIFSISSLEYVVVAPLTFIVSVSLSCSTTVPIRTAPFLNSTVSADTSLLNPRLKAIIVNEIQDALLEI